MAYVHVAFEPLRGWREVEVSERRRGLEFAHLMHHLAEEIYPDAEKIRLVCDNLSTHSPVAFYEAFSPEIAHHLAARKIEFCYTPVHGSWLNNMVEIEISVLVRQCLKRRLPDIETLSREATAWCKERNRLGAWSGASEWRMHASSSAVFTHQ